MEGFVCIHETQNGRCIVVIDKETANSIIRHLDSTVCP